MEGSGNGGRRVFHKFKPTTFTVSSKPRWVNMSANKMQTRNATFSVMHGSHSLNIIGYIRLWGWPCSHWGKALWC